MKTCKTVNVAALLKNLDSYQLTELRKQFNKQCSKSMWELKEAERVAVLAFIDGLSIDRGWNNEDRDVVSLNRYTLTMDQRRSLNEISESISRAFRDLNELKTDVAREAKRSGTPFSKVFTTTVRRMNKYRNR